MRKEKRAYSMIIVIVLIWFMLFLTTWVFRLVLNEMKDNNSIWNYSKAYIWAESASEIALLNIKEKWYGFNEPLLETDMLWTWITIPKIKYINDGKTKSYSWTIEPLSYNIMPLFYIKEDSSEEKITNYALSVTSWTSHNLSWNIVWKEYWISWFWDMTTKWAKKTINWFNLEYEEQSVSDFLWESDTNYLILFNNSDSDISYNISSNNYFTKPKIEIISSASVWWFKQNIKTDINYVDMTNRSKYSIYSPN